MNTNNQDSGAFLIGIISDTHGYLNPQVFTVFKDVHCIIHAGDIGDPSILTELETIAPVHAVRGNTDIWAAHLPPIKKITVGPITLFALHDLDTLPHNQITSDIKAVISGHTHQQLVQKNNDVLFINPGTAGRKDSPGTVALLRLNGGELTTQIKPLQPAPHPHRA
ncbi:MAG: metallophosphoesterase family protein [Deltaproteobacteria bacterium]|nr:metallophosphoesterase family protein [Deltaproteobacteria bacterium]